MITAQNVHKTYGKKTSTYEALKGINLSIKQGESLAILGKSGSGKSTLMHLLAGLDRPTRGEIRYDDKVLATLPEKELASLRNQRVGFVFQQFYLQPTLTVLENVMLPLTIAGMGPTERKRRAFDALKKVGLQDKMSNRATDLSGGQKQRVAIARALVSSPAVVFADEPTGNLDSETAHEIIALLLALQKREHLTLVVVTHDQDLAKLCERQIHIKDGQLEK